MRVVEIVAVALVTVWTLEIAAFAWIYRKWSRAQR